MSDAYWNLGGLLSFLCNGSMRASTPSEMRAKGRQSRDLKLVSALTEVNQTLRNNPRRLVASVSAKASPTITHGSEKQSTVCSNPLVSTFELRNLVLILTPVCGIAPNFYIQDAHRSYDLNCPDRVFLHDSATEVG
jgi:hypothetical protein